MSESMMNMEKNEQKLMKIDQNSKVPLFGLDFLGVLDRATNVLEVKPITICNLHCKYCFVSAGDYNQNFTVDKDYLVEWIKKAIDLKKSKKIEIHLAAYGEVLLYKDLIGLITELRKIPEIETISMQSNGLLLTEKKIRDLEKSGLDRINISLNSMDKNKCADYCGVKNYNLDHLLDVFEFVLKSNIELLIAPVWFMGINDQGILDIIDYIKKKEQEGYKWPKLRLGIQNYLTYRTGRKIRKARMRDFGYFYKLLQQMEKEYNLKLKLGPKDFNIHKTPAIFPPVRLGEKRKVEILMKGRWDNEYIAIFGENWAVKILTKIELQQHQSIKVKFIKSSLRGNLLTAIPN
ncbi:MAG: radical SAM protein [Promethearchaeota archaeon]